MDKIEFSFEGGGAVLSQLRKLGILGPDQPSMRSRILIAVAITWLPLLILTASRGVAFGDKVQIPFLSDLVQSARFLIALPLAIWAERYISPKVQSVLNRFVDANLITGSEIRRLESAVAKAKSLMNSVIVEIGLIAIAYLYMSLGLHRTLPAEVTTWGRTGMESGVQSQSLALSWYYWVSLPIFLFVWLRWIWRQVIWTYLLFQISRLRLALLGTHPDHAGGLAFLSVGQRRFAVLVFAISAIASASIAENIFFRGATLRSFESELTTFFFVCVLIVMGPLMVFSPQMIQAKLRDWGTYGILAATYTQKFDDKWIKRKNQSHEEILGNQDFQALADLKNGYEGIGQMRVLLPDRQTIIVLLIAYALPILPLLATVIPLRQILSELFKLLMK